MSVYREDMHYPDPLKKPWTKVTVLSSELVPPSSLNSNSSLVPRGIRTSE